MKFHNNGIRSVFQTFVVIPFFRFSSIRLNFDRCDNNTKQYTDWTRYMTKMLKLSLFVSFIFFASSLPHR